MQAAVPSSQSSKQAKSDTRNIPVFPEQIALFVLVTVLFFLWGMSNNLTDILVQQFRKSFELSPFGAQLVSTANFTGYFVMAIPAALIMRHWGYKTGMVMGLVLFGSGMVLFWPAAVSGQYIPFLIALFAVGCGASVLETAANPFMAQFGPPQTSERRLNFAQSFNPPGTILGVIIGGQFIFSGVELTAAQVAKMKAAGTYAGYLHSEIMRVVPTYLALGSAVLLFALVLSRHEVSRCLERSQRWPRQRGRRYRQLCGTDSLSPVMVRSGCERLQHRRADLHVEQPDSLHEAVHAGDRAQRGTLSDGDAKS